MLHRARAFLAISATFLVCLLLHETGHAIAGWLTGGRITEFAVLSIPPHVRIAGEASPQGEMLRAAGGTVFFLTLFFVAGAFRRSVSLPPLIHEMATWFAGIELAGWLLPSLFRAGTFGTNDAERFLSVSGINPYWLAVVCAAIGAGILLLERGARVQPEVARPLSRGAAAG